ncbi:SDR family oxidoreductase [soil metagenome]
MVTEERQPSSPPSERLRNDNETGEQSLRKKPDPTLTAKQPEVVVVTGASAGLGRAIARAFAREGAHIGLLARGRDGLEGARTDVEALGGKALVIPVDVADAEWIERSAQAVEREFGPIDIWINNAMVSVFSPVKKMTPEEYKRVTEVTYLGVVYGTLVALKRMLPRDRGSIVQVGSALAYRGIPLQSAYCAAKHAIQGFHDSLHSELIHDKSNVRVTMVQLPAMNTPQFSWVKSRLPRKPQPVPPIYQPEIGADAVLFAAHNDRREMYVGYPTVEAIIGDKIAPGFADWYLARNGYDAQQTNEPVEPDRRDNLWEPVPGDHGAHGTFGDRATASSPQLWMSMNRKWLGIAGAGLAGLVLAALIKRKQSNRRSGETDDASAKRGTDASVERS